MDGLEGWIWHVSNYYRILLLEKKPGRCLNLLCFFEILLKKIDKDWQGPEANLDSAAF